MLSKDRAPFCYDRAWLAVDDISCSFYKSTSFVFGDIGSAAQIKFELINDTDDSGECIYFYISVAGDNPCNGLYLNFTSEVIFNNGVPNNTRFMVDGLNFFG